MKQEGAYHFTGIAKLSIVGMLVSFSGAFLNTIWAIYLDSFLHSEVYVGLFSSLLTLVAFVSYFLLIPYVEKSDKSQMFASSLIAFVFIYLVFALLNNFVLVLILSIVMTGLLCLRVTSYGLLVKDISEKGRLSSNEGIVYTFLNISFVIGPLIAGFLATAFGISLVFVISSLFLLTAFVFFKTSGIRGEGGKKKIDKQIVRNFVDFFRSRDRLNSYLLRSGVTMWWILIYLFVPLWMIRQGMTASYVGVFLFAVNVPLIALEYFFSRKAEKEGFRKVFKLGYALVALFAVACFVFTNVYAILSLLVLASIGIAMLEPTTEAYFFDVLKGKERYRFYGPFNTSVDFGNLIAKVLGSALLAILPFKFIFLLFAAFMALFFFLAFGAKDIVERG